MSYILYSADWSRLARIQFCQLLPSMKRTYLRSTSALTPGRECIRCTWSVCPYAVVLPMSWTLCIGSMVSGQRRMQGANTIAKALADMRFVSSCKAILKSIISALGDSTGWEINLSVRLAYWPVPTWRDEIWDARECSGGFCLAGRRLNTLLWPSPFYPATLGRQITRQRRRERQTWCPLNPKHRARPLPMARMNSSYSSKVIRGLGRSLSHCLKTLAMTWML